MNFFQSQAKAKSQTRKLVFMFCLAVLSLIILTNLLIMFALGYASTEGQGPGLSAFNWEIFLIVSAIVLLVVLGGSLYKINDLRSGGGYVAKSLGGTLVKHDTTVHQQRVLLNVVEEMAIAAGTPVPPVYLLRNEKGINAFAAGFTTDDAAIGVTQGALDYFTREELQGVIAHEFSHIIHGDMRLNMRLIGILHGILLLGLIGYYLLRSRAYSGGSKKGGNQLVFLAIGLIVIGYGGTFFGNMIKASVSRKREYLADASAVQYTRNNRGIADALKKIGGYSEGSNLETKEAPTMSHAYFANGIKSSFMSLFATHPPLDQRIKAIEPDWTGTYPKVTKEMKQSHKEERVSSFTSGVPITSTNMVESVGQLGADNISQAQASIASIPSLIKKNIYSAEGAMAVFFGLLLAKTDERELLEKQLTYVKDNNSEAVIYKLDVMLNDFQGLEFKHRLPLMEIALPQLRSVSREDSRKFLSDVNWLIKADDQVSIFEWSIESRLKHYLKSVHDGADYKTSKYSSLRNVKSELEILMSLLSSHFVDQADQEAAANDAKKTVGMDSLNMLSADAFTMDQFSKAVESLALLEPELKEKVIEFCYLLVTRDDDFSIEEQETVRALSECLGCPMPMVN